MRHPQAGSSATETRQAQTGCRAVTASLQFNGVSLSQRGRRLPGVPVNAGEHASIL
jgi:hypothetical protein